MQRQHVLLCASKAGIKHKADFTLPSCRLSLPCLYAMKTESCIGHNDCVQWPGDPVNVRIPLGLSQEKHMQMGRVDRWRQTGFNLVTHPARTL